MCIVTYNYLFIHSDVYVLSEVVIVVSTPSLKLAVAASRVMVALSRHFFIYLIDRDAISECVDWLCILQNDMLILGEKD